MSGRLRDSCCYCSFFHSLWRPFSLRNFQNLIIPGCIISDKQVLIAVCTVWQKGNSLMKLWLHDSTFSLTIFKILSPIPLYRVLQSYFLVIEKVWHSEIEDQDCLSIYNSVASVMRFIPIFWPTSHICKCLDRVFTSEIYLLHSGSKTFPVHYFAFQSTFSIYSLKNGKLLKM